MRLKRLLCIFIFTSTFIKPSMAVVILKKPAKIATEISKTSHDATKQRLKKIASKKKGYMHGTASYYGKGDNANGKQMANGETFNTYDMFIAAHPTLPLGTKLKVVNNLNGKIVYVEIKDRMPIHHGRVIDLSYAAASRIGMQNKGLSPVTLVKINNNEFYKQKHLTEIRYISTNQQG